MGARTARQDTRLGTGSVPQRHRYRWRPSAAKPSTVPSTQKAVSTAQEAVERPGHHAGTTADVAEPTLMKPIATGPQKGEWISPRRTEASRTTRTA